MAAGSPGSPETSASGYTAQEIAARGYVVLHGGVYDVRPFLTEHPGGEDVLREAMGTDATQRMAAAHAHSHGALQMMARFRVGTLAAAAPTVAAASVPVPPRAPLSRAPSLRAAYGRMASVVEAEEGGGKTSIAIADMAAEEGEGEWLVVVAPPAAGAAAGAAAAASAAGAGGLAAAASAVSAAAAAAADDADVAGQLAAVGFSEASIETALAAAPAGATLEGVLDTVMLPRLVTVIERPPPPAAVDSDVSTAVAAGAASAPPAPTGAVSEATAPGDAPVSVCAVATSGFDALAHRKAYLTRLFIALGYKRKYVERAVADTDGRGCNAVLDWFKALWRPADSGMFRYRDVDAAGLRPEVKVMTARLREMRAARLAGAAAASDLSVLLPATPGLGHVCADEGAVVAAGGLRHVVEQAFCFPIFNDGYGGK